MGPDGEPLSPYPLTSPDWYVEPRVHQAWTSFIVEWLMIVGDRMQGPYIGSSNGEQTEIIPGEPFKYGFSSASSDNVFLGRRSLAVLFDE